MVKKRVVVTGMGVVSCYGNDPTIFYEKLLKGESGVKTITKFSPEGFSTTFAAEISSFDPEEYIDKKQARRVDPFISYAFVAAKKALAMAGLFPELPASCNKERMGILIGSGIGGMQVYSEGLKTMNEKGANRISPFFIPYILTNMAGGLLAIDLGFMGPNYAVSTACATSNFAFIQAADLIRKGDADVIVAGGSEAGIVPIGLGGFNACKALSERNDAPEQASRPWDKARDGFVMGEGAGVLVLESLEHALARGAPILAEYLGGSFSCDAYHMTEPSPEGDGIFLCLKNALLDAGIVPEQVDYINAHATSTPLGDVAELKALKRIFKNPEKIVINATKSMIGHSLGAAGGLEAVATIQALRTGWIHPTINLQDKEEELTFIAPTSALEKDISVALSNSFGFGGHNACIFFGKYTA